MSCLVSPERRSSGRAQEGAGAGVGARRAGVAHVGALAALLWAGATACDGGARPPDARARPSAESAEVSVRFDVSTGKPATVHVLAFRATVSLGPGIDRPDVLGTVDPLAAASPEQGCMLRDLDVATRSLGAHGASIELEEMSGIGVGLGVTEALLRPFPHLYPDVATVVGGVVGEVGPQALAALPERVSLYTADSELPVAELTVPPAPRITAVDGLAPAPALRVTAQEPLTVTVTGAAGGLVELRPYGATMALACAVSPAPALEAVVSIPRALLARLVGPATATAASLEVARRIRLRQSAGVPATRISVEVRSATTVELRP